MITAFIEEAHVAPDELSTIAYVMIAPPMPFLPEEHHGRPALFSMLVYAGATDAGRACRRAVPSPGDTVVDMVRPMRYTELYEMGEPPPAAAMDVRWMFIDALDRSAAELTRLQRRAELPPPPSRRTVSALAATAVGCAFRHRLAPDGDAP